MLDNKKNFNIGAYLMDISAIPGTLSHELLASLMPFYCCWLPDVEDESQPCIASVALASMLYSTHIASLGAKPTREWRN
jgi:hypothetical protein